LFSVGLPVIFQGAALYFDSNSTLTWGLWHLKVQRKDIVLHFIGLANRLRHWQLELLVWKTFCSNDGCPKNLPLLQCFVFDVDEILHCYKVKTRQMTKKKISERFSPNMFRTNCLFRTKRCCTRLTSSDPHWEFFTEINWFREMRLWSRKEDKMEQKKRALLVNSSSEERDRVWMNI
jgi:hypothetical protein